MKKIKDAPRQRARKRKSKRTQKTSCGSVSSAHAGAKATAFQTVDDEVVGESSFIREASYRLGIPVQKLKVAVAAARLGSATFDVVETLVQLNQDEAFEERLEIAAKSISEVLGRFVSSDEDPFAEVDETSEKAVLSGQIEAELELNKLRRAILANCIGVEEAAVLAERTRQRLEDLRRKGKLLALRVRNRWRYPRWQFDPDYPGGVLPGLGEVLAHLQLSPLGAAAWLTKDFEALGNHTPIYWLGRGQTESVIELAEEQGHMP